MRDNIYEGAIPSFDEFKKTKSSDKGVKEGEIGVASAEVRKAVDRVHAIQLDIQKLDKEMLTVREKFLAVPKGDDKAKEPLKKKLIDLNHKKLDLRKQLDKAELDFERELGRDEDIEDLNMNLL